MSGNVLIAISDRAAKSEAGERKVPVPPGVVAAMKE